jgi:hypothetical protein
MELNYDTRRLSYLVVFKYHRAISGCWGADGQARADQI